MKRLILLLLILMNLAALSCNVIKEPKEGEIWRFTLTGGKSDNPFDTVVHRAHYYDFKVLAVKSGYVQYLDLYDSSVSSSSIDWFKLGSKCISCNSNQ